MTLSRITALIVVCALAPLAIHAHPMPGSTISLDLDKHGVRAELRLPMQQLEIGFGRSIATPLTAKRRTELAAYVARHLSAIDPKGSAWRTEIGDVKVVTEGGVDELSVIAWLTPPPNASPRRFTLRCDVILHELLTHTIVVQVRRDWKAKIPASEPVFVGQLSWHTQQLAVTA
jgi:hypothetical protein